MRLVGSRMLEVLLKSRTGEACDKLFGTLYLGGNFESDCAQTQVWREVTTSTVDRQVPYTRVCPRRVQCKCVLLREDENATISSPEKGREQGI